jgi:hypothetical protein
MPRGVHVIISDDCPYLEDAQLLLEDMEARDVISGLSIIGTAQPTLRTEPLEESLASTTNGGARKKGSVLFIFRAKQQKLPDCLDELDSMGVGKDFGNIDLFELTATKPLVGCLESKVGGRKYEYRNRRPVEEIFNQVDDGAHLVSGLQVNKVIHIYTISDSCLPLSPLGSYPPDIRLPLYDRDGVVDGSSRFGQ